MRFAFTLLCVLLAACEALDRGAENVATVPADDPVIEEPTPLLSDYPDCYNPDQLTATTVAAHGCTWLHTALTLQDRLDREQPLQQSLWLATHNSANSTAYPGPSSSGDPNQSLSIPDQLRLDLRGLELDVHWYPHAASGANAPVLCHALGASMNHAGCSSSDRHLREGLIEIAAFLDRPENKAVVLMVDIENQLSDFRPPNGSARNTAAHDLVAGLFETHLGSRVYRPQGGGCQALPLALSKAEVIAAGKQIILTSDCGEGSAWPTWVYNINAVREQKANDGFNAYPDCESSFFSPEEYATRWTRLWEDTTDLGARTNASLRPMDAATLTEMIRCGVHMPSVDQLAPNDTRAQAMVWSWAPMQPRAAAQLQCAQHRADGHFEAAACTAVLPFACRTASGWVITSSTGMAGEGPAACAALSANFDTPYTGADNQLLVNAKGAASIPAVWLAYREVERIGNWQR